MKYVVGFLFDPDMINVVLIQKNSPKWQAGYLNGVGGKIEPGEKPLDAMIREFREETGLDTGGDTGVHWYTFAKMSEAGKWAIEFFVAQAPDFETFDSVKTTTDEWVCIKEVGNLYWEKIIPNLTWLLPLSIDFMRRGSNLLCAEIFCGQVANTDKEVL